MVEIVGVGFTKSSKTYYFDPNGEKYGLGELVIVETARGVELAHITIENKYIDEEELVAELKPIMRRANEKDLEMYRENQKKRDAAMEVCQKKIANRNLDMKLIDAEYTIDGSKIIFYFSADGRIDFRELVKDLAGYFKKRIELRQIGVRDEAKLLGGYGICGRPFCCSTWMGEFQSVSIKMAKTQNVSLNPSKISGVCGRLMCCFNFENKTYQELRKGMPAEGDRVRTPDGLAKVVRIDIFNGLVTTRAIEKDKETHEEILSQDQKTYSKKEVKIIDSKKNRKRGKSNDFEGLSDDERKEMETLIKE